ncbi:hypothetical protein QOZ80_2BG0168650 [Eleusine coracana subsp. coracana]|nr:hypothetical protein QOZ80_2BG0168650 [Eleusine coracana subsp. coracana]
MARFRVVAAILYLCVRCLPCLSADADFRYNGFQRAANLSLDGSASVLSGGALRLTDDKYQLTGHAFLDSAVQMRRAGDDGVVVSFSTAFVFQIVTTGSRGGDGLAFVISPSKALLPGQPRAERVGRRVSASLESGEPIQAWVDYDGVTKVLNVTIAPVSVTTTRPRRPLISRAVDLLPVFKNDMYYVGFSATTGNLSSSHYILAWSFRTGGGGGVVHSKSIDLSSLPQVPNPPTPPLSRSAVIKIVALAYAGTLAVIVAAIGLALWLRRRAVLAETLEEWELDHPHRLPYRELYIATKGFKASELLGAGGFGQVYRGVLRRSVGVVAIKRISNNGTQGMREFVAEVASLGRLRHRNLVELRGWCKRGQDLLLVYEYMPEARPTMRQACQYLVDGKVDMQEIVFTDRLPRLRVVGVAGLVVVRHNVHGLTTGWPMIADFTNQLLLFGPCICLDKSLYGLDQKNAY